MPHRSAPNRCVSEVLDSGPETREIAGTYMHEAWQAPPLDNDAGMNISGIDYAALKAPQDEVPAQSHRPCFPARGVKG